MKQQQIHLSLADQAWLSSTLERNRARFGGWRMDAGDGSGGDGGGTGDGAGGDGDKGGTGDGGAGGGNPGGSQSQDGGGGTGGDSDKGFPANTPVAQMKPEEQTAYWQHQARKHETRNQELLRITGGKHGDDLQTILADYEKLKQASLTDAERAIEDAKKETREQTLASVNQERVRDAFDLLLGDMPEQDRTAQIDLLDLSKFITDAGRVDTAKVRQMAERIAPADKEPGKRDRDYGQGTRGGGQGSSISSGRSRYQERRGKSAAS